MCKNMQLISTNVDLTKFQKENTFRYFEHFSRLRSARGQAEDLPVPGLYKLLILKSQELLLSLHDGTKTVRRWLSSGL
jgi:hypothetical protein